MIDNYEIREVFTNFNKEKSNYYFDIKYNDTLYNLKIYNNFNKKTSIIKSISYYEGNTYTCILPTFLDNSFHSDIKCNKNGIMYNYNDVKGKDDVLDKKVVNIITESKKSKTETNEFVTAYLDNNDDFHTMLVTTYKGYCILNEYFKCYNLFNEDSYKQDLRIFTDDYYLIADYNDKYDFYKFYYYNLKTNKRGIIQMISRISFNSFFQGIDGNKAYLIDKESKEQYVIDIDKKTVKIICNEEEKCKVLGFDDTINMAKIINKEIKFKTKKYNRLGNSQVGFTYIKINNVYYKVDQQNTSIKTYAFKSDNFTLQEENIYYIKDDYIYLYNPNKTDMPIIKSSELIGNNKLIYKVR